MTDTRIQDFVSFDLRAETVLVNNTVKIIATVTAMVSTSDTTDAALREEIRAMMKRFIDAEWQFSNIQRIEDESGMERVVLTATARVPETENYNLKGRAEAAGRVGMKISEVEADTSIPTDMIEQGESDLRLTILRKALAEVEAFNAVVGDGQHYRLSSVQYGRFGAAVAAKSTRGGVMAASMALESATYGSGFGDDGALGNAQKISLTASIQLARVID